MTDEERVRAELDEVFAVLCRQAQEAAGRAPPQAEGGGRNRSGRFADWSTRDLFHRVAELRALYGVDDRVEVDTALVSQYPQCESVAAVFERSHVTGGPDGTSRLETQPFGDDPPLCECERFRGQPAGGAGTAFIVGERLLATANHVVEGHRADSLCFVFGFRVRTPLADTATIPHGDIYCGDRVYRHQPPPADWALVEVDRPFTGRRPLKVRTTGRVSDRAELYVIGHPAGLPLKIAKNAKVRDNDPHEPFFVTNLDTYSGNSGSPVFDADTGLVEGVVVRGGRDWVPVGDCQRSLVCRDDGGRGEDCTRTTEFSSHL